MTLFISLGLILSVSGTPAPPPLQLRLIHTADGTLPSWHAWDPDANFQSSSLCAYVQAAHAQMLEQAACYIPEVPKPHLPGVVASLWVKNKGIYTASNLGKSTCYVGAPLHPRTQALFDKHDKRLNTYGGYCSCIQVINGFYEQFPNDDIPPGSEVALYGHRYTRNSIPGADKLVRPCRGDRHGVGCVFMLWAANIKYDHNKYVPPKPRAAKGPKRPRPGSDLASSSKPGLHSYRKVVLDMNLPPDPEVNPEESIALSSGDSV